MADETTPQPSGEQYFDGNQISPQFSLALKSLVQKNYFPVTETGIMLSDNTTDDVSTAKHGLAPKITTTSGFLKGDGTWAIPSGNFDYGDGSDGAGAFDGSTVVAGLTPSASVYTLTRDIFLTSVVVSNGVTISKNGYRIFSNNASGDTNAGTIDASGGNGGNGGDASAQVGVGNGGGGTAGTAGVGFATATVPGGISGKAGFVGMNGNGNGSGNHQSGTAGTSEANSLSSNNGVAGGNSGRGNIDGGTGFTDNSSTAGGAGTAMQTSKPSARLIIESFFNASGAVANCAGSGSGAGGGGGVTASPGSSACGGGGGGGGSGSSGGVLWLACKTSFTNTGTIKASGGSGGNGGKGANASGAALDYGGGGGGGGGGGNGGLIVIISPTYTNSGTATIAGGGFGTGGSVGTGSSGNIAATSGANGTQGNAGSIVHITP